MNQAVITEKKPWWQSRTLWLNAVVACLIALEMSFPLLQPLLPGNVYAWFGVVLAVGNSMLRIVTTQGLSK